MQINIKKTDVFMSDDQEQAFVKKIEDMCRFMKDEWENGVGMIDFKRTSGHHQSGEVFAVKIQLKFPGTEFFVESSAESIDEAFVSARDKMDREIRKDKSKRIAKRNKFGRIKRLFKGFRSEK